MRPAVELESEPSVSVSEPATCSAHRSVEPELEPQELQQTLAATGTDTLTPEEAEEDEALARAVTAATPSLIAAVFGGTHESFVLALQEFETAATGSAAQQVAEPRPKAMPKSKLGAKSKSKSKP